MKLLIFGVIGFEPINPRTKSESLTEFGYTPSASRLCYNAESLQTFLISKS